MHQLDAPEDKLMLLTVSPIVLTQLTIDESETSLVEHSEPADLKQPYCDNSEEQQKHDHQQSCAVKKMDLFRSQVCNILGDVREVG